MANGGNEALVNKRPRSKLMRAIAWIFKLVGVLNFNFFYSLSLLIMISNADHLGNLAILAFVNIFAGLPLAMIFSPIQALFSFREAQEKSWRTHPTIRFAIDAFYAATIIAMGTAVYVTFLWPSALSLPLLLAVNIPLIITAVAIKAIYNIGAGIYYINKAISAPDDNEKNRAISKAISNLVNSLGYGLITGSMIALYFFPLVIPPAVLIIGVIGCTLTFMAMISTLVHDTYKHKSVKTAETAPQQEINCSNSKLHKKLGGSPAVEISAANDKADVNPIITPAVLSPKVKRKEAPVDAAENTGTFEPAI